MAHQDTRKVEKYSLYFDGHEPGQKNVTDLGKSW